MQSVCHICPHACVLEEEGDRGKCLVREKQGQSIVPLRYGHCSTIAVEPIEKRPFFHFLPGSKFLSVGFYGCSLSCDFCLPGDALISTPSGSKRIDQIREGDEIYAVDDSHSFPQLVLTHAGYVFDREAEELIELEVDGQTIQLTPEHPVLTKEQGWVEAKDLTVDDEVLCDKND